jgi:ornithine decarboxylase
VSAVVLSSEDLSNGIVSRLRATGFDLPLFVVSGPEDNVDLDVHGVTGVLGSDEQNAGLFGRMVETSAAGYDAAVLPPFFGALSRYERRGYSPFDCPGHQGGQFFMRHPAGRRLVEFFGENLFRADLCNADVSMGMLIHEGAALEAEKHAAKVFHSDQTYFVLNGTSASNKVALGALLTPGDVVLFDRNNHKSVHHGALLLAAATPVYLETSRNEFGLIGGIDEHCFADAPPEAKLTPADAYRRLVRGRTERLSLAAMPDRTATVMVVPLHTRNPDPDARRELRRSRWTAP